MPALMPIILTASHIVLAVHGIPKFNIERICRPDASAAILPGRDSTACQEDESDARAKLAQDWTQYSAAQRASCTGFVTLDHSPSYVELLTCLEMAKQARELPQDSKTGATIGSSAGRR